MEMKFASRTGGAIIAGAKKSVSTILFLLKIMVPTSFIVALLGWSGLLQIIAGLLSPLMRLIGLPGQAALVFISGALLNNYSAIAVMGSLSLSLRDATILALMCLTAHNLIVETAVMKSAGSSAIKMALLRIGMAIVGAFVLNLLLPSSMAGTVFSAGLGSEKLTFLAMLGTWGLSTLKLIAKIVLYVLGIMIIQSLFDEFKIIDLLSKILAPFMKIFGLPAEASFLWIVINIVGYAYGAGIIKTEYEAGRMKKQDGDLFNHHAAISHSLLEDTILYSAIGIGVFWLVVPRLVFATVVVWIERFRRNHFKKSFRVGTV
ncbi:MAG TPA: nucleoside recognition domain-containing protein [Rectinemataceae bacterium]|nr:nucleoside recognition domain-containing protein [Rectinemataceae bacterium]